MTLTNPSAVTVTLFLTLYLTNGAKILVYSPTLSKSHMINNARVADALAKDGHNVTIMQVHLTENPHAILSRHANVWPFDFAWSGRISADLQMQIVAMFKNSHPIFDLNDSSQFHLWLADACRALLNSTNIVEQIRAQNFDMFIGEQVNLCGSGISHAANIPIHLWLSSGPLMPHMTAHMGLPTPSSYIPTTVENNGLSDQMTLWQRADNLLRSYIHQYLHQLGIDKVNEELKKHFGADFPDVGEIAGRSPLILVTSDEFIELPRTLHHNVIYIGGLGLQEDSKNLKLPPEFEAEMQKGHDGVVLISFGSVILTKNTPKPFVENILRAIKDLPRIHFILKLDKNDEVHREMSKSIKNLYVTSWHPQPAILNHERLRLFVTHAGYGSVMDAGRFGTPLLMMGFFSDQNYNAMGVQRNGWGKFYEKSLLLNDNGHKDFGKKIVEIVADKGIKTNALRIQRLILTKPIDAEQRLQTSIRFLFENGGQLPELQPFSVHLSALEFYNLDLVFIFAALLVLLVFSLKSVVSSLYRLLFSGGKKKTE